MSDFRAIAGVSSSLRTLLRDRMDQLVEVTIAPPDIAVDGISGRRINLYLYRVDEDAYLRNQDVPGRTPSGAYGRPPLWVTLDYLITSYGSTEKGPDADLEAQQILGDAMRVLHDFAIVGDDQSITRPAVGTVGDPILDTSLRGEFEQVKIAFQKSSLEEFSKIWTALPQANFRRAVTYRVSVVEIESRQPRSAPLPVTSRNVFVLPFASPVIEEVFRDPVLGVVKVAVAEAGETVTITGANLGRPNTRMVIDPVSVPVPAPTASRLSFVVPNTVPAGTHSVQVVQDLMLEIIKGQPLQQRGGWRSNALPMMVIPKIILPLPAPAAAGATIAVQIDPPVEAKQQVVMLLDDFEVAAVHVPANSPPRANVQFRLPVAPANIPPGVHLMRVRVDGAESRLTVNAVTLQFDGPPYTVLP